MDRVWWGQVTSARSFVQRIVDAALSGKSVVLELSTQLPWYDTLCKYVENALRDHDADKSFEYIASPAQGIGRFVMEKYCTQEKCDQYRPIQSHAAFLAQSDDIVLNDKYIWVRNVPPATREEWIDFLIAYGENMRRDKKPAIFLLELREDGLQKRSKRQLEWISYKNAIHPYDSFLFCALAASGTACEEALRSYLAELTYNLCGDDIELAAACMEQESSFLMQPEQTLCTIINQKHHTDGSAFSILTANVQRHIWECQIKTIFPLLEQFRNTFATEHEAAIMQHLPINGTHGETWTDAQDVELGTLFFWAWNQNLEIDKEEYDRLKLFKDARNKLAHLKTLEYQIVEQLFAAAKE